MSFEGVLLDRRYGVGPKLSQWFGGSLYLARDAALDGRWVLIELVPTTAARTAGYAGAFKSAADRLKLLRHPMVPVIQDIIFDPSNAALGLVYEYMELVPFDRLKELCAADEEKLRQLFRSLAEGLSASHRAGFSHRNLAPPAILCSGQDPQSAKLFGFQLGPEDHEGPDFDPVQKRTLERFLAPERLQPPSIERAGPRADIYGLARIVEWLCESANSSGGVKAQPFATDLAPLLERMTKTEPADRLGSMADVLSSLAGQSRASDLSMAGRQSSASRAGRGRTRFFAMTALGMLAGAVVVAGAAGLLRASPDRRSTPPQAGTGERAQGALVRPLLEQALAKAPCAWLSVDTLQSNARGVDVRIVGIANDVTAVRRSVEQAIAGVNAEIGDLAFDVGAVRNPALCQPLEVFRSFNAGATPSATFTTAQSSYVRAATPDDPQPKAHPVLNLELPDPGTPFEVLLLDEKGRVSICPVSSRTTHQLLQAHSKWLAQVTDGSYRLTPEIGQGEWFGAILMTGRDLSFDAFVRDGHLPRQADVRSRMMQAAQRGGWKAQFVAFAVTSS